MKWSWLIALKKVALAALASTFTILITSGGLDNFLDILQTGIGTLGLPGYLVPVLMGALALLRNFLKQKFGTPKV